MVRLPDFAAIRSIDVFCQIRGVQTETVLARCLYRIDDAAEIRTIVDHLDPIELTRATQRKATNWLVLHLDDGREVNTDLDEAAGELRVTSDEGIAEFSIGDEAFS